MILVHKEPVTRTTLNACFQTLGAKRKKGCSETSEHQTKLQCADVLMSSSLGSYMPPKMLKVFSAG